MIHHADLAEMYRLIIENHGTGMFFGSEPEAITLNNLIEKFSQLANIKGVERVDNVWGYFQDYSFFMLAPTFDQQIVSKRHRDLWGYSPNHRFIDWLNSQQF